MRQQPFAVPAIRSWPVRDGWHIGPKGYAVHIGEGVHIGDYVYVGDGVHVPTQHDILIFACAGSRKAPLAVTYLPEVRFSTGCQSVDREEFLRLVQEKHGDSSYAQEYRLLVALADVWLAAHLEAHDDE